MVTKQVLRFIAIGIVCFIADVAILSFLNGLSYNPILANLISTSIATGMAFFGHNFFTFSTVTKVLSRSSVTTRYVAISILLGIANFVISSFLISISEASTGTLFAAIKVATLGVVSSARFLALKGLVFK
jgi:putative flippase GtrA